ncbi:hypothetical protein GGF44_003114 [Coemansia sp. RSA 1694]|nr:hypothetical protein IWW47_000450 [Coemansia sp. RSA 2052]KAJ2636542.1 hypothetical protein GGF44_003114 [Coemansia sp. RSA 1694]
MDNNKQCLQQANAAGTMRPTSGSSAPHDIFLNLHLEPFLSSSLMDLLDVLVYPAQISPSVPSTPPPTYEHPPPSYPSSDAWSIASFSTLSLAQFSDSVSYMSTSDAMSIVASEIMFEDNSAGGIVVASNGTGPPLELQNRLLLNLVVYELLTHQSTLSRSPSRASGLTTSSEFLD